MNYSIAFLFIFLFISECIGITPNQPSLSSDASVRENMQTIFDSAQDKKFRVMNTTPTLRDLGEREIVLVDSGTVRMYFRINNKIKYLLAQ